MRAPLGSLVLGYMLGELGREVQEVDDSNWSPRIEEYALNLDPPIRLFDTDGDGMKEGYPYCAMAVQFVSDAVCRMYDVPNPLDAVDREAFVADYYAMAMQMGWLVPVCDVLPGDIVMYRFGRNPTRWNHIGIVFHGMQDDGKFRAVEANTSPPQNLPGDTGEAEREGSGIWAKDRTYIPERVSFARPWGDTVVEV